jgi:hypothetical protein
LVAAVVVVVVVVVPTTAAVTPDPEELEARTTGVGVRRVPVSGSGAGPRAVLAESDGLATA